mgnify:CR=1 FL=1
MGIVIESPVLGVINVEQSKIYTFAQGIPGFEDCRRFAIFRTDAESPFAYFQSADRPELVLLVTDPFFFFPDYDFELPDAVVEELGLTKPEEVEVWVVVTVPERMEEATVNLVAPIVLNRNTQRGRQAILSERGYAIKQPLFSGRKAGEENVRAGGGGGAGSDA